VPKPSNVIGAALGLVAFACYSVYDILAKVLGGNLHPVQIIAAAGLMTMPMLAIYAWFDRKSGSLWPVRPGLMVLRSAATVVNYVSGVTAFTLLPLAEAYVIFFTMPLFIAVLAVPVLKERFDPVRGLAVLIGLAGVYVALDPQATPLGWGHAMALTGAVIGALNYVIIRKTGSVETTTVMMVWPQLALFAAVSAALPLVYVPMEMGELVIAAMMAVAIMGGMLAIIAAYRRAAAIVVAPMQYSQFLWAVVFGVLLFDERPDEKILKGCLMIAVAGIMVVMRPDRMAKASG
jgi:S-adenosylmethionine uptake transporter